MRELSIGSNSKNPRSGVIHSEENVKDYIFGNQDGDNELSSRIKAKYHELIRVLDGMTANEALLALQMATLGVSQVAIVHSLE